MKRLVNTLFLILAISCSSEKIQVNHFQVPVVAGQDVAVAKLSTPEISLKLRARGVALDNYFVKDSLLYVNIEPASVKELAKPFRLELKARGYAFEESGALWHRAAIKVRSGGDDGVAAYRIPGIVTSKKGTLIATYDIRHNSSFDLQEDIDVGISRSLDGGLSWEPMITAMDMGTYGGLSESRNGIGDPCILLDEGSGDIILFAAWAHGGNPGQAAWWSAGDGMGPETTPQLMMSRSTDDGVSWSAPVSITPQVKRPEWFFTFQGPGRGITASDGTLVVPFQHQDIGRMPYSGLIYSKDGGKSWNMHDSPVENTTESQVAEVAPGVLMLNMRNNLRTGRRVFITRDYGKTWEKHPSDCTLEEPVCMAGLLNVPAAQNSLGKDLLFFSNPADKNGRCNITIRLSLDGGESWPSKVLLDEGTGWGYSCLTMIDKNTLGILYESSQAHITFQAVSLEEFK